MFGIGVYKKELTAIIHTYSFCEEDTVSYLVVEGDMRHFDGYCLGDKPEDKRVTPGHKTFQIKELEEELERIILTTPMYQDSLDFDRAINQGAYLIQVYGI